MRNLGDEVSVVVEDNLEKSLVSNEMRNLRNEIPVVLKVVKNLVNEVSVSSEQSEELSKRSLHYFLYI